MEMDTRKRFKDEVRSFFGLTILNLMIAAMILALGISLVTTQVLDLIGSGHLQMMPFVLMGLGFAAVACGFYWIIKIAEIIDGIDDIKTAYDKFIRENDQEPITHLIIQMMAHYRANRTTVSRMAALGRVGGVLFLAVGAIGLAGGLTAVASDGLLWETAGQLVAGIMAIGVGIGGLVIAHYFTVYSKVWTKRLDGTALIEDALQSKLEVR